MTIFNRVWIHKIAIATAMKDHRFVRVVRTDGDWSYCSFVG